MLTQPFSMSWLYNNVSMPGEPTLDSSRPASRIRVAASSVSPITMQFRHPTLGSLAARRQAKLLCGAFLFPPSVNTTGVPWLTQANPRCCDDAAHGIWGVVLGLGRSDAHPPYPGPERCLSQRPEDLDRDSRLPQIPAWASV
jgi:hypothetical protein